MYVVIAGAGNVGAHIADSLLKDGHNVAVVESDRERLDDLESMDVLTVHGNAACPKCLSEAGINSADLLIAVTGSDETNIIACIVGKSKGCKTIARLRNPDYILNGEESGKHDMFSIDLVVSQDVVTANHISKTLLMPAMVESGDLAEGHSLIVEIKINEGNASIGRMPASIRLPPGAALCSISRGNKILEPDNSGQFHQGDRAILVLDSRGIVVETEAAFGVPRGDGITIGGSLETGIDKIVMVGANETSIHVAGLLEKDKSVVIIDKDPKKCQETSAVLEKTIIINGDATDSNLFMEEGLEDANILVATTENSEYNMLSCLLAKKKGVARTMAIVDEPELRQLFEQVGVDIAISPRMMVVDFIIRHISGKQVSTTQTTLHSSGLTVMEILVKDTLWMAGKEYSQIKFPKGAIIGSVIRDGKAMRPTRFDTINPGDRMIVMVRQEAMPKVEKLFSYHSGLRGFR